MRKDDDETRGRGLRALGVMVPGLTRPLMARRSRAEATLILDWPQIAGPLVSARSRPLRLAFPNPAERRDGVLTLTVEPSFALDLQHLTGPLVERINGHFGYRLLAGVKLVQAPLPRTAAPAATPRRAPLSAAESARVAARTAAVEDPELRQVLERLGAAVYADRSE
ncbi:hypothetical protein SAMN06265365_12220 [Tistlia consotensis]|uniref:DUF721 domain-containing protein n=1 Tax=Tistlia consotensis USBA 355 TaxID=560819 RepID=A0A1Y6CFN6_9PROT|nr:DciA family protein [Tistlia consotensis]SMF62472.1 hypothetical protein SAMN05428998_12420 [Tistlia consotensis USBA 355]SNR94797.1 hypothetical protein SAMN06265365_12220 [Tistlia consotensis]